MSAAQKIKPQIEIKLVIQNGPHAGQRFSFSKPEINIGRSPENDIVLINDASISRMHAKIHVLNDEVEILNISQKNAIIVNGESVQKWKLVNDGIFSLGDSEFKINFDLGQSVVAVKPTAIKVVSAVKPQQIIAKNPSHLQQRAPQSPQPGAPQPRAPQAPPVHHSQNLAFRSQQQRQNAGYQQTYAKSTAEPARRHSAQNSKAKFYILIAAILVVAGYFYLSPSPKKEVQKTDSKMLLKYEDEVAIKLNSKTEEAQSKIIKKALEEKKSPMNARAEENFIKGIRDFQLGNYLRAQEFFQVVLNLQPDHQLARRHLYLSKVRFDELVKAKIMLGESYYQKHNFRMCQSMYNQVLVMLQGKSSDQNYKLAEHMMEKCRLASEGIR